MPKFIRDLPRVNLITLGGYDFFLC